VPDISPARRRLGARLRELRALRFRSGTALAEHLGWQQSRVSKLETGTQLPSEADLTAWLTATGQTSDEARDSLAEMVMAARLNYRVWTDEWARPGGIASAQDAITAEEMGATRLASLQPAVVPGLVQTQQYAREVLTAPGGPRLVGDAGQVEQMLAARQRRQELLYAGKTIQLVMSEAALRIWFISADTLRGQRDRLIQAIELPGVEIGILPFDRPNPVPGFAGFDLIGSTVAFVESLTGEQRIDAPDEVAVYVKALDLALAAAVTGDAAIELIKAVRP
jgi:transcriptional regulator with XRE-family HTH domain